MSGWKELRSLTDWISIPIPDSSAKVDAIRLAVGSDGSSSLLVRFPAGWTREVSGFYECAEEFVVLEGELRLSDFVYVSGDHGWVPARGARGLTHSPIKTYALAHFFGIPKWINDKAARFDSSATRRHHNCQIGDLVRGDVVDSTPGSTYFRGAGESVTNETGGEVITVDGLWSELLPGEIVTLPANAFVRSN